MANTVRYFFDFYVGLSNSLGSEILKLGGVSDPTTVTLSSDYYQFDRVDVPSETVTIIANVVGRKLIVPSVDGRLVWSLIDDYDNSAINLRAGVPFLLPARGVPYNAAIATIVTGTPADIGYVYFYQDSGATAYVDVLIVS